MFPWLAEVSPYLRAIIKIPKINYFLLLFGNYIITLSAVHANTNPYVMTVPINTCIVVLLADLNFGFMVVEFKFFYDQYGFYAALSSSVDVPSVLITGTSM